MNYEGKSVFDRSGGGGNDPQVQINTDDIKTNTVAIDVTKQLGYIAAFQRNPGLPATGTTQLDNTPRIFYNIGYAPDPAFLNRSVYTGQRFVTQLVPPSPGAIPSSPYGLRWTREGESSAVFRIRVRVTLLSRTDCPLFVFLRVEQRTVSTLINFKDYKKMEYLDSPIQQTFRYELDLVTEINIDPAALYVDFNAFGEASIPGQYTFEYSLDSDKDNSIDVQRLA